EHLLLRDKLSGGRIFSASGGCMRYRGRASAIGLLFVYYEHHFSHDEHLHLRLEYERDGHEPGDVAFNGDLCYPINDTCVRGPDHLLREQLGGVAPGHRAHPICAPGLRFVARAILSSIYEFLYAERDYKQRAG